MQIPKMVSFLTPRHAFSIEMTRMISPKGREGELPSWDQQTWSPGETKIGGYRKVLIIFI